VGGVREPGWAPGTSDANAVGSRCCVVDIRIGRAEYSVFSMTVPSVGFSVSSTGGAVVTVTVSDASPTARTGLKTNCAKASRTRFSCVKVLNPLAVTVTEYIPTGNGEIV